VTDISLHHITLDTGHVRQSPRSEVSDAAVTLVRQQIEEALAGMSPEIQPGYVLRVSAADGGMVATVATSALGPLCTLTVASDARLSRALWDMLEADAPPPEPPWCAVRLYPALEADLDAALWLGDFSRVAAWAWLESPNG